MSYSVRQAIVTKYIGPSNFRGSRIKARAAAGSVTLPYEHRFNIEKNHARAAEALAGKFGWSGDWYQGGTPDSGYCFVNVDRAGAVIEQPAFHVPAIEA